MDFMLDSICHRLGRIELLFALIALPTLTTLSLWQMGLWPYLRSECHFEYFLPLKDNLA